MRPFRLWRTESVRCVSVSAEADSLAAHSAPPSRLYSSTADMMAAAAEEKEDEERKKERRRGEKERKRKRRERKREKKERGQQRALPLALRWWRSRKRPRRRQQSVSGLRFAEERGTEREKGKVR